MNKVDSNYLVMIKNILNVKDNNVGFVDNNSTITNK